MPAPSLETLFAIEDAVEPGVGQVFHRQGFTCFDQQGKALLTTPRIEIQLQLGAATGHKAIFRNMAVNDAWDAILIFRTVTNRKQNGDQHSAMRARIRLICQPFMQQLAPLTMPWHVISVINEAGTTQLVDDERGHDISEIHFASKISIRSGAWPVA